MLPRDFPKSPRDNQLSHPELLEASQDAPKCQDHPKPPRPLGLKACRDRLIINLFSPNLGRGLPLPLPPPALRLGSSEFRQPGSHPPGISAWQLPEPLFPQARVAKIPSARVAPPGISPWQLPGPLFPQARVAEIPSTRVAPPRNIILAAARTTFTLSGASGDPQGTPTGPMGHQNGPIWSPSTLPKRPKVV